ncbi:hypothetical protein V9W64_08415 [Neisseria leonii]|uniref:Uncharacterized protein n=1 Tax=Neisseria leonii TaxID=2995413 RepID=A0A9X4IDW5_9NEIS|nr:hypothetical protein [Neisseria sp. 51.81]MDD9327553.1 hypothetical protein [Neisseria sp. 51.81]
MTNRTELLKEFDRPKVISYTPEEIAIERDSYRQIVASFALENAEPKDFYKVISMERIRGEPTEEQARAIMLGNLPEETERIQAKLNRLAELGLSWKDL